jgi:quercetin dioxygenase-like cupin family protein
MLPPAPTSSPAPAPPPPPASDMSSGELARALSVAVVDRRLTGPCVPLRHLAVAAPDATPVTSAQVEARHVVGGRTLRGLASPRLLALRLARGDMVTVIDACALWPQMSASCQAAGHAQLRITADAGLDVAAPPRARADTRVPGFQESRIAAFFAEHSADSSLSPRLVTPLPGPGQWSMLLRTWGKTAALMPASSEHLWVPLLLTHLDELISYGLPAECAHAARDGTPVPVPARSTSQADAGGLSALLESGATVVIDAVHLFCPAAASAAQGLQLALRQECQANVYLTPPAARGFTRHHDPHDTILVQLAGRKRWSVWPAEGGTAILDEVVHAGDILYIPAGYEHEGHTTGEASAHVTFGVFRRTAGDLVRRALRRIPATGTALAAEVPFINPDLDLDAFAARSCPSPADLTQALAQVITDDDQHFASSLPAAAHGCVENTLHTPASVELTSFGQLVRGAAITVDGVPVTLAPGVRTALAERDFRDERCRRILAALGLAQPAPAGTGHPCGPT